jgi:hypothetical protein
MSATVYRSRVSLLQALLLAALFLAPGPVFAQSSHHRNRANDLPVRQPDPDSKTFLVPWILLPSGPVSPTRANTIDDRSGSLGLATISSAHRAGAQPATARHGSGGAQSTDNWIGGKGNWSVSTNWSAGLPVSTSDVTITNLGSAVTEDISATISTLTVGSGDSLVTNNNIDLTIDGATITNSGAMVLNSIGNTTELVIGGTTTTLSGGGTLALSNSTANFILGNGTSTLVNANNTILGAGNIGDNNLTLNNQGTIMASGSAGLTVNPLGTQTASSPGLTNTGTLESSAGSTLALVDGLVQNSSGAATGTIQTDNGVVQITTSTVNGGTVAVNGGSLQLSSSTVTPSGTAAMTGVSSLFLNNNSTLNAAVSNSGTGVIETSTGGFFANTISGNVTNPAGGQIVVGNNTGLVLSGSTVTNTGTIELNSIGNTTELEFGGTTTTLTGGGTVTLSNTTANFIFGTGASTLVNANNTILGSGNLGDNNLTLNNQGTIMASGSAGLTVNPLGTQTASSPGLTNTGTLESSLGSTLALVDGLVQNSSGATNGTIQTNNGVLQITTSTVNGGTIAVNGGSLQLSSSTVSPAGTVAMTGVSSLFVDNNSALNAAVSNSGTGVIETSTGGFFANTISGNVTNPAGGQVIVGNNTGLVLSGSTVTNTGSIELNSIGNNTDLEFGGTTTTLSGGGTVTLSNTTANFIFGTGASTLVNANNTILGSGNLGDNNLTLNNQGTIMASGSAGLTVNPLGTQTANSPGLTNTGTLESSLGSTLALVDGLVQNSSGATNGTIQTNNGVVQIITSTVNSGTIAVNGGSLQLSSSTVTPAGTVAMTGVSSLFLNNNSTLNAAVSNSVNGLIETSTGGFFANTISGNVTNPAGGQVIVGNNTGLVLSGSTVTNTGSIELASIGNTTELEFGGTTTTLSGGRDGNTFEYHGQLYPWKQHQHAGECEQHDSGSREPWEQRPDPEQSGDDHGQRQRRADGESARDADGQFARAYQHGHAGVESGEHAGAGGRPGSELVGRDERDHPDQQGRAADHHLHGERRDNRREWRVAAIEQQYGGSCRDSRDDGCVIAVREQQQYAERGGVKQRERVD